MKKDVQFHFTFSEFAWEAYEKGADVHLQADPTRLELLASEYKKKKEDFKTDQKESILDKYGGKEHLEAPPKQLLLAQTVSNSNKVHIGYNYMYLYITIIIIICIFPGL